MYDTLISSRQLAGHLDDPEWVICDCRFVLSSPEQGLAAYREGHIPRAVYFHLDRDLSGAVTATTGRHPPPSAPDFVWTLEQAGIGDGIQVVAYDDAGGAIAARLWWLLRWLGHDEVAVLDGGWSGWVKEGRPVTTDVAAHEVRAFTARPNDALWLDSNGVLEIVNGRSSGVVLDARGPDRFRGENETIDPVAGHIPGAVSLPFAGNLDSTGHFKPAETLREQIHAALGGCSAAQAVCMCGSGVTACHNLLAMELAGLKGARLYAGSWSEWIRDPSRPITTGG
ncbi:MAG TPA: sulfurtransferase [Pseudomonadales bacterium]|nr:sulfurtransferase [Pseudomonadales bacterium]